VRLAFAVAAHLDSEILLADEVLSVGDAAFQKKCLGKMESVSSEEGKTIVFVSHNMATIRKLCNVGFFLADGKINYAGKIDGAIMEYLAVTAGEGDTSSKIKSIANIRRTKGLQNIFTQIWIEDEDGRICNTIPMGSKIRICVSFSAPSKLVRPGFGCSIISAYGDRIASFASYLLSGEPLQDRQKGTIIFQFSEFPLLPGDYTIDIGVIEAPYVVKDRVESAYKFTVDQNDLFKTGQPLESGHGLVYLKGSIAYKE
jgi:lipopolysaccharide transport system ATP-binding protein